MSAGLRHPLRTFLVFFVSLFGALVLIQALTPWEGGGRALAAGILGGAAGWLLHSLIIRPDRVS